MTRRRDSPLREAFIGLLVTVGPFFGVRYRPPRVEIPVVTTPARGDGAAGDPVEPSPPGSADADAAAQRGQ